MSRPPLSGRVALAILIVLMLLANAALLRLRLDNAPEAYFPASSPTVRFESELRADFPLDQVLIALFEGPGLWDDAFLNPFFELVATLERDPLVERVLTVSTLDHIQGDEAGFQVAPLLDRETADALNPTQRLARVLGDRFAPGLVVAEDGEALALVLRPRELNNSLERLALEEHLRAAVSDVGLDGRLTSVAGQVALDVAQLRAMIHDTLVLVPGTLSLGLFIIWFLFRRVLAVVVSALVIAAVVNLSVALLILAGKPYTLISAILPPLMSALTVAGLIHWLNATVQAAQLGLSGQARVDWVYREVARPILFASLTTAVGLASLSFSSIQPIAAFGQVAAVGMVLQASIMVFLVPPIFARWDRSDWTRRRRGGLVWIDRLVRRLRTLGMRRPLWVIGGTLLLLADGLPQIWRVQTETDLLRFFASEHPITRSTERIQERLVGVTMLELVFDAGARDALMSPERLRVIRDVRDWLQSQPEVDRALSMVDLIEEMHWGFHAEDPAYRELPDDPNLIAQYLLVYDGTDLYELVDREFARARLTLNLSIRGARAINDFIDRTERQLAERDLEGMQVTIAGFGRLFADQERLLIEGQIRGLAAALLLIALLMLVFWRSLSQAVISLIPNVAPILFIFIFMGVFGIWLDMATAMIASVTVGIAIDDTIHLMHAYRQRLTAGSKPVWALARAYQRTGRAIVTTTIILCGQFLLLGVSDFVPTIEFGLLTAAGLLVALIFDLLFLPALLLLSVGKLSKGNRSR